LREKIFYAKTDHWRGGPFVRDDFRADKGSREKKSLAKELEEGESLWEIANS